MLIVSRLPNLLIDHYGNTTRNLFSAQGALTQQAKDYYPMSNLDENALNLLPQTSSQASNGEIGTENAEEKSLKGK